MFGIVEAIHKALKIESTLGFVLVIALGTGGVGVIVGGFCAWIVDQGYRNSAEYRQSHPLPKIEGVTADNVPPVAPTVAPTVAPAIPSVPIKTTTGIKTHHPKGITVANENAGAVGSVGSISQGPGSIAQIGGNGNTATVNIDTRPHINITDAQQSAITGAMKQFSGRKAFILSNGATAELVEFGTRMEAALQAAGIQAEYHSGMALSEGNEVPPWLFVGWGQNNTDMANALVAVVRDAKIVPIAHVGVHFYDTGDKDGFQIIVYQPN